MVGGLEGEGALVGEGGAGVRVDDADHALFGAGVGGGAVEEGGVGVVDEEAPFGGLGGRVSTWKDQVDWKGRR